MTSDTAIRRMIPSPYSAEDLGRFRRRLQEQRDGLLRSSQNLSEAACRTPGDAAGLSNLPSHVEDLASETFEQELSLEFLGRVQAEMRTIVEALDRIDAGIYGVCLACGQAIAPLRLEAIPTARHCIPCQSSLEN